MRQPGSHVAGSAATIATLATAVAGVGMALQSTANGELGRILGHGLLAATYSFGSGLIVLIVASLLTPKARRGIGSAIRYVRSGEFPWWMTLGGLGGAMIVLSQSVTVPLMGVAVFTMAFVSGQLTGALVVDNTHLPPGGRKPPTLWRIVGTLVVIAGVALSAVDVLGKGIPLWAPILPFVTGGLTALQQAFNGRLRIKSSSAIAATTINFFVGTVFLVLCTVVLFGTGFRIHDTPQLPGEWWVLIGGLLGIVFIGVTTVTVARLGVLLLSLVSLFGNLLGSLVIDLTFHSAEAEVGPTTFISMAIVLVGLLLTTIPSRKIGPPVEPGTSESVGIP
ncbi:MAG: DMT family transporter [Cumulibacter sp.]